VRLGGVLTSADGGGIETHAAARELDYYLRPIVNLERSQYGADVNLDRPFRETQVPADELVRLALNKELEHVALSRRQAELL
jgi:hypothetical protein